MPRFRVLMAVLGLCLAAPCWSWAEELLFEDRCKACHMNYEGSPWPKAARPYTPFTPAIDPKYGFDFARAVRSDKAMHEHFKLEGVFVGPPLAAFRDEFQSRARPPAEGGDEAQR